MITMMEKNMTNESGQNTQEQELWEQLSMDTKVYLDLCQKMLDEDPEYKQWLIELSEREDDPV